MDDLRPSTKIPAVIAAEKINRDNLFIFALRLSIRAMCNYARIIIRSNQRIGGTVSTVRLRFDEFNYFALPRRRRGGTVS
jgi:hypothetical protein